MEKELICISCPVGCNLTVTLNDQTNEILNIVGNSCKFGIEYATNEITCPRRMVTTTVRCTDGDTVAVKTSSPVKKSSIFEVLKKLKGVEVSKPVNIGDVLVKSISEEINIIATSNAK